MTAQMDSVPMLLISGQQVSWMLGKDAFQEADIFGITMLTFMVQAVIYSGIALAMSWKATLTSAAAVNTTWLWASVVLLPFSVTWFCRAFLPLSWNWFPTVKRSRPPTGTARPPGA